MLTKLLERIKKNWINRKWLIYGTTFAFLINYLLKLF